MEVDVKDLIERFKDYKDRVQEDLDSDDDFLLAVVLAVLEEVEELDRKETPMKAFRKNVFDDAFCPKCRCYLDDGDNYCPNCGQALEIVELEKLEKINRSDE